MFERRHIGDEASGAVGYTFGYGLKQVVVGVDGLIDFERVAGLETNCSVGGGDGESYFLPSRNTVMGTA